LEPQRAYRKAILPDHLRLIEGLLVILRTAKQIQHLRQSQDWRKPFVFRLIICCNSIIEKVQQPQISPAETPKEVPKPVGKKISRSFYDVKETAGGFEVVFPGLLDIKGERIVGTRWENFTSREEAEEAIQKSREANRVSFEKTGTYENTVLPLSSDKAINNRIADMARSRNIPSEHLDPSRYLFEPLYLPKELHALLSDHLVIDEKRIVEKEQLYEQLKRDSEESDYIFMGLGHTLHRSHEFVADVVAHRSLDVGAIALEIPPHYQSAINMFLETGKFHVDDDLEKYPKLYQCIEREGRGVVPKELQGTSFDNDQTLLTYYPILLAARAKGLDCFSFDPDAEHRGDGNDDSEAGMKQELLSHKGEKSILVVCGGEHASKKRYSTDSGDIDSVAQRLEQDGKKVKSYFLDSYQTVSYEWMADQVSETVLHAAVMKGSSAEVRGLQMEPSTLPNFPNQVEARGIDTYVAIT